MKRYDNELLLHNIKINGLKALIYCYGLGDNRYVEYSLALDHLCRGFRGGNDYVLDIGSGHSIFPTFLVQNFGSIPVILDTNPKALKWQIQKSTKITNKNSKIFAVKGSATNLPFKDETFAFISCISVIEHLPGNLDVASSKEIGRVLKPKGDAVITVPGVGEENAIKESTSLYTGIPYIYQAIWSSFAEDFSENGC
jgi:ubiquinone/menaquinone biosynthesis C-methylase UbiE